MKKNLTLFLLSTILLSNWGCATVVSSFDGEGGGRKEVVMFRSNPTGATVYVNDVAIGITPFSAPLSHKGKTTLRIEKTGYKPEVRSLRRTFNWVFLGNILIGGVPAIIDLIHFNELKFDSKEVKVVLLPHTTA